MGRIVKYKTDEDRRLAQLRWAKEYYWRNKNKIDEKNKRRYWISILKSENLI